MELLKLFESVAPEDEDFEEAAKRLGLSKDIDLFYKLWLYDSPPLWEKICLDKFPGKYEDVDIKYLIKHKEYDEVLEEAYSPFEIVNTYVNLVTQSVINEHDYAIFTFLEAEDEELSIEFDELQRHSYFNLITDPKLYDSDIGFAIEFDA